MADQYDLVARHYWRRTARVHERILERVHPGNQYRVVKAKQGPFLWWVVKRNA